MTVGARRPHRRAGHDSRRSRRSARIVAPRRRQDARADASSSIETSIVSISPTSGPVGTPVTIHLKGVGWTEYDNIYVATYDNAYMGYACGFNSQGDVVINFTASRRAGRAHHRSLSRHLPGTPNRAAAAVPAAAADLRRRSSRKQDPRAAIHVRGDARIEPSSRRTINAVTSIGIVGLGIMGLAMAGHLLRAGHRVVGYDVRAARVRGLRAVRRIRRHSMRRCRPSGRHHHHLAALSGCAHADG